MKKIILPLLSLFVCVVVIAVSCKKIKETSGPKKSLNQLFSDLRSTPQNFTVEAGRDTVVYGINGTKLHFYTFSFKDATGNILTSGTINVDLIEMYKPGDMMQNRATTVTADGQPLISGGQICITANRNGANVIANKFGVGFRQPGSCSYPMELFYGNTNNEDSVTMWIQGNNTQPGTTTNGTVGDTIGGSAHEFYQMFDSCTSFGWINADKFWGIINRTNFNVILPDNSFNPLNTEVFLIFPEFNSVSAISNGGNFYNSAANQITSRIVCAIGSDYKIVAITNKNGSYYYCERSGVVTSDISVKITMTPETRGDIIARMAGL